MDIQTLNKEEFDNLHPSMKDYLVAGTDLNPYGSNIVTEKNFFNMNLFSADPYSLDPNLSERTEKARADINYAAEGFKTGLSHGAELFASIPGGLDRFYDWGRKTLGFEPTTDSIFDYAEQYLKDIAHDIGPEFKKDFIRPEGFVDNFWYGLGQAIPTIATYIPFIRATAMAGKGFQAVQGIGKTARAIRGTGRFLSSGSSLPAGIAITDMTREIDDGKLGDIAIAGAYGYGTGKVLNIANKLNILPRMAGLGAFGYLSSGWEADPDERLAAAAVWSTLGILGPLSEGKSVRRQLSDVEIQTKQLMGLMEKPTLLKDAISQKTLEIKQAEKMVRDFPAATDKGVMQQAAQVSKLEKELVALEKAQAKNREEPARSILAENMFRNDVIIREHKNILKDSEQAIKFEESNAKRVEEGKEPLPTPEKFLDKIMSAEQVAKHEKFIKDLEAENAGYGKIVWTNNNYNKAIFGFDRRPTELFKQDMYNKDGTAKYKDMKDQVFPDFLNFREGQQTTGASMLIPAKFVNHPVVKYVNDQIAINKQKTETLVEMIAYDPILKADSVFAPGKTKTESFGDYTLKLQSAAEAVRLIGMRKIKSDGGGLTKFTLLRQKNPDKAADLVDAIWKIERDKLREAKKNKEDYSTRIDLNEGIRREARRQLTESEIRRIEELQQSKTSENRMEIDAEINLIRGTNPFVPVKEGGFKYEITNKELQTKYKFDNEQISIYRELRGVVDKTVDIYNKAVKENKADGLEPIQKIPNYFPHIFQGDFVVFVKKWSGDKKGYRPIDAPGVGNKVSANALNKYLKEEYDAIDVTGTKHNNKKRLSSDYIVETVMRERQKPGNEAFHAFNELFTRFELTDEAFLKVQERIDKIRQQAGFKKFSLQRIGVDGYLGSKLNAREYFAQNVPGLKKLSETNINTRQAGQFETAILQYLQGGIESASRIEFNKKLGQILNQPTIVSDGKGGTKKTALTKDYPVATQLANTLKENAFGEIQSNKFVEKMSEIGSDYIGKSGLTKILGGANQVTLNAKLLFGNMRFLLSQVFQPYHMIFPRLVDLQYKGFDKGQVALSQVKAFKDLLMPNKEMREVQEFMYKNGVVDQKFLNEAAADIKGFSPKLKIPGGLKDPAGRKVFDFGRILKILTLQDFAGKAEQVSRLNASFMFYNFFRSAGKTKQQALEMSAYNANKYMVEYNYLEQPGIYGSRGLGAVGKPFGLFKTFQHNYLAQLAQYVTTAKESKGQNVAGLAAFMTQMVFAAGVYGVIGFESAERILRILSPTIEKFTGKPLPSLTETILTSSLPGVVKYGAPSSALGIDLTATLAAPGVNIGDLISVPALDYLGLNPLNGFAEGKGRGIIPTGFKHIVNSIASDSEEEKRESWVKFLSAIAPSSMQGYVEQYYNGLPSGYWKYWTPSTEFKDAHSTGIYENIVKNPFKRGRGQIKRTFSDWRARTFASYSLEEKEALKLVYVTTRLKRNLRDDISGYLTAGAQHLMKEGFVPLYIIDRLKNYGLTFDQIWERVTNRSELMNTTILDRLIKKTNALQYNDRISKLREMVTSRGFQLD